MRNYNGTFDILEAQKLHKFPGVTLTTIEFINYHNRKFRRTGIIVPSQQRVMLLALTLYFPKHSFYVWAINKRLEYFKECGLIKAWSKSNHEAILPTHDMLQQPRKLSLNQIDGIFVVLIVLCIVCTFVFAVELISTRVTLLRSILNYL